MTVEAPRSQEVTDSETGRAELALWGAALASLVNDARAYWRGKGMSSLPADSVILEAAFDDLLKPGGGPMLRHCCRWLDTDPEVLSRGFLKWCEDLA